MRNNRRLAAIASIISLCASLAACSKSATNEAGAKNGSAAGGSSQSAAATVGDVRHLPTGTDKLCGTKPLKFAQVDGFGGNSWRKIVRAELTAELSSCKNVTVSYTDAGGDVTKYNAAINSYVARGYKGIVTFDDFGTQGLSSLRNATKAGLAVVPYISEPGGKAGTDYTAFLSIDKAKIGQDQAAWLKKLLGGKGNLLFMGGVPGNSSSQAFFNDLKPLAEADGFKFLVSSPVDTNWDPAQEQRAMAGLISKYPKIDAIASDYGVASVGGLRAYLNAGKASPPLMVNSSDNDLVCQYDRLKSKWPNFQLLSLDGGTAVVRWAARRALATINHEKLTDPETFELFPYIDTANSVVPKCDPSMPPDADLSSSLTPEQLRELFK